MDCPSRGDPPAEVVHVDRVLNSVLLIRWYIFILYHFSPSAVISILAVETTIFCLAVYYLAYIPSYFFVLDYQARLSRLDYLV